MDLWLRPRDFAKRLEVTGGYLYFDGMLALAFIERIGCGYYIGLEFGDVVKLMITKPQEEYMERFESNVHSTAQQEL